MRVEATGMARSCRIQAGQPNQISIHEMKLKLAPYIEDKDDVLHPLDWFFLRAKYMKYTPVSISFYDTEGFNGIVLLYQKKLIAIPLGIFVSPYECGFCSYFGTNADKLANVQKAAALVEQHLLFSKLDIFVEYERPEHEGFDERFSIRNEGGLRLNSKGSYFPLKQNLEETISRFSQKTRKNLRHYRRVAESEFGCRYIDDLTHPDALSAVKVLNAFSARSMGHSSAAHRCRMTMLVPGGFSAGLIDKDGNWLSYISGWRTDRVTYIDWQINKEDSNRFSFSAAMRNYLIQNEIAVGAKAIYFLGGSNSTWENGCDKQLLLQLSKRRSGWHARSIALVFAVIAKFRPLDRARKTANKIILLFGD